MIERGVTWSVDSDLRQDWAAARWTAGGLGQAQVASFAPRAEEMRNMTRCNRRKFLGSMAAAAGAAGAAAAFHHSVRRAFADAPRRRAGTIEDVGHVVILMQENRSFDHYFGTLAGVRGFGDRFPIPVRDAPGITRKNVWYQSTGSAAGVPAVLAPFRLDTNQTFAYMRVKGTPHTWPDAQHAWADGRIHEWPRHKKSHSLGYFTRADLPFQFALAEAFTICDAYYSSFQGGTNPNRLFLWTGSNDPLQGGGGPAITSDYDKLEHEPAGGYTWTTYPERLQGAGITWQIYQNLADNYTDNPLAGFRRYRDSVHGVPGSLVALKERGLSTRDLDKLKEDVAQGTLPQVSWIIATAEGSEHPEPSSPVQGADYTARVLDALTSNSEVWSRTVLFVNFDENDGFFDHVPPPAPPSIVSGGSGGLPALAGDSTVDTVGEYHEFLSPNVDDEGRALHGKLYGLGPRVPMYVISPWSAGGWVNSEVFDHTSVIRFLERRFGVYEPNISPWRRAVCGDLTSAFDFSHPTDAGIIGRLPNTTAAAERARALPNTPPPPPPELPQLPVQELGTRPSRALPYELHVHAEHKPQHRQLELTFVNTGRAGAVFQVYDRKHLEREPRRYTVEAGRHLVGVWDLADDAGGYALWVLGPNGFHRGFTGTVGRATDHSFVLPEVRVLYHPARGWLGVRLRNDGTNNCTFRFESNAYSSYSGTALVRPQKQRNRSWSLHSSAFWYDITVKVDELPGYSRRFAGRVETGRHGISDPAMGGLARGDQA